MKKTTKIVILTCSMLILSTSMIFLQPTLATAVEQYGWEDKTTTIPHKTVSKVKIQSDAVYNDNNQGGVAAFGVWISGEYDIFYFTSITTQILVQAEYEVEEINWKTGQYYHYKYWSATPSNFMSWGGEYSYNSAVPGVWTWSVGAQSKYMSLGASYQANPKASYGSANTIASGFRYIGWFRSQYPGFGGHEFSALLKLHLTNDVARSWANGIWEQDGLTERLTKIINIRVKLVFTYSYYVFPKWWSLNTHTHTMGDGDPYTDLNYIPLVVGSSP